MQTWTRLFTNRIGPGDLGSLGDQQNIGMHGKHVTMADSGGMCKVRGFTEIAAVFGLLVQKWRDFSVHF